MSEMTPGSPFDPGDPKGELQQAEPTAGTAEVGMRYLYAYSYVFESRDWLMNLLWGSLAFLSQSIVPFIGQIVFIGYQFEIVESLHRQPNRPYPSFDINRFVDYLTRGIWPFLVSLIVGIFVGMCSAILYVLMIAFFAVAAAADESVAGIVVAVLLTVVFVGALLLAFVIGFAIYPMMLRAGLSQDLGQAFNFKFVKDFIRRTWLEMLLMFLFVSVTGLIVGMIGLLMFCIGIYPAAALVTLAQAHFYWQLYELYLSRGGEPIPLKQPKAIPPQVF